MVELSPTPDAHILSALECSGSRPRLPSTIPALIIVLVAISSMGCAPSVFYIPGLGKVQKSDLCEDENACGVQGEEALILLREGYPPVNVNSVESILGTMVDPQRPYSNQKPCLRPIMSNEFSEQSPTHRTIEGSKEERDKYQASIAGNLKKTIGGLIEITAELEAAISEIAERASRQFAVFRTATYTINDESFKTIVDTCPAENLNSRIVKSVTIVEAEGSSSRSTASTLRSLFAADARIEAAAKKANMGIDVLAETTSQQTVQMSFSKARFRIAVGFNGLPEEVPDAPGIAPQLVKLQAKLDSLQQPPRFSKVCRIVWIDHYNTVVPLHQSAVAEDCRQLYRSNSNKDPDNEVGPESYWQLGCWDSSPPSGTPRWTFAEVHNSTWPGNSCGW